MTDLTRLTATELSELYSTGSVSPVDVAQQVLAKIERLNPVLNAFCFTDPATTLAQAQASKQRWCQGQSLSPLDGVPISVKDSIFVKGWPTLQGSYAIEINQPWTEDDVTIASLRNAGAVFLGKTSVPEFNFRRDTYSRLNGMTRNPWNTDYSPGGSSGRSSAAVAAGLGPISIGSDFGGSLSLPAAFCGVIGFKPSGKSVVGPITRSVADLSLAMQLPPIKGNIDPLSLKIAYWPNQQYNASISFLDSAIRKLNSYNIDLIDLVIDRPTYTKALMLDRQDKVHQIMSTVSDAKISSDIKLIMQQILSISDKQSLQIREKFHNTKLQITKYLQQYDLIISASASGPAFAARKLLPMMFQENKNELCWVNNILWSMLERPVITLPIGLSSNGLPLSMQIVGTVGGDDAVLQFAKAIELLFPPLRSPLM